MSINQNNITDIDDSTVLENTPMIVIEQGGKSIAIPIKSQKSGGSGSGDTQFYFCTGYDGVVDKIIITAGAIYDEMEGMTFSIVGEYNIVDPGAVGTARKWYCAKTTANGEYEAYNYGVTIGCAEIWVDWDDELEKDIYEKCWAICPGKDVYSDGSWLISPTANIESPFDVTSWGSSYGSATVAPVLTSDVVDVAPYGPTGWKGRPIVMTNEPVFFSYGAGVESANGFWEQIAGDGLSINSQWQLIGTDSIIKDGNSSDNAPGSYHFWILRGTYRGEYQQLYDEAGDNWQVGDIKHPGLHTWENASSSFDPPPTFVYSETGGYAPAKDDVSGLMYAGKPPEIGGFYNADATIKAERFFPA